MAQSDPDLGEKALSKVAEVGIVSQLDEVEELNVDIRTNPVKLVKGEVDSVTVEGKGMVVKQDLRMESLEINTDKVSINPLNAVFGNIELTQPTEATAQAVLTEADINRAFGSDYLHKKLHGLTMEVDGKPATIDVQHATVKLPGDGKLSLRTDFSIRESGDSKRLSATVVPKVQADGQRISLDILKAEGQGLDSDLVNAIFEQIINLLDLRNFDIPGLSLRLNRFEVQTGKVILHALTTIEKVPSV